MRTGNFAFEIVERAFERLDNIAFVGASGVVSYRRFVDLVLRFGQLMQELRVDQTSRVGLLDHSPVVMSVAATAAALLGAQCGRADGRPNSALNWTHVFAGQSAAGTAAYVFTRSWFETRAAAMEDFERFPGHSSAEHIWMVTTSSGTTGTPKHIPITYRQAWQRIVELPDLQDGIPPISFSLFDAGSYAGLKPRLTQLAAGGTNVERLPWDQLLASGVNRVFGSPAQVGAMLGRLPEPAIRIRACRVVGAAVTRKFVDLALEHFDEVQVLYGSTEAGAVALGSFSRDLIFDGSVGKVLPGAKVEVVDTDGFPLGDGLEGQLRIHALGQSEEYLGEPQLSAKIFKDDWFHPGDLGFFADNKTLHITGRVGEVINSGGTKFNASELDEVIQLHPAVADGFCFVDKTASGVDAVAAIVSTKPSGHAQLRTLRTFARERLGRAKSPRWLYVTDVVPRNENGKALRTQAAQMATTLVRVDLE